MIVPKQREHQFQHNVEEKLMKMCMEQLSTKKTLGTSLIKTTTSNEKKREKFMLASLKTNLRSKPKFGLRILIFFLLFPNALL